MLSYTKCAVRFIFISVHWDGSRCLHVCPKFVPKLIYILPDPIFIDQGTTGGPHTWALMTMDFLQIDSRIFWIDIELGNKLQCIDESIFLPSPSKPINRQLPIYLYRCAPECASILISCHFAVWFSRCIFPLFVHKKQKLYHLFCDRYVILVKKIFILLNKFAFTYLPLKKSNWDLFELEAILPRQR